MSDYYRMQGEALRRMVVENGDTFFVNRTISSDPPPSYTSARSAVSKYISTAPEQQFSDIVGNEEALAQLRDAIEAPVKYKALYEAYGMKMPKGGLLSGPPGCGKTMFARAAASTMKQLYGTTNEFLCLSGSELQQIYVGQTEQLIKALFTYAREYKAYWGHPLLIFIDEADVILPDRSGRIRRVHSWEESQVAAFLTEMDGVVESGAFVLLASNRPEVIDSAVLRDGRCDFKITVKRPNLDAVRIILEKNFAGTKVGPDPLEVLVEAGVESLFDPSRVIIEGHALAMNLSDKSLHSHGKHFLLEHIISGAMAASLPARATRLAFARDKATGIALGVTFQDVVKAVDILFEENKKLDHSYALEEFGELFMKEFKERLK